MSIDNECEWDTYIGKEYRMRRETSEHTGGEVSLTTKEALGDYSEAHNTDLYTYLDSIVHEALPHNYEDLNPRELRELLTSALYERLTEDKDFQSTYIDLIFRPKDVLIQV